MAYRDKDSIVDQINLKHIFSDSHYEDLKIVRVIEENAYLKKYSTLKKGTYKIGF